MQQKRFFLNAQGVTLSALLVAMAILLKSILVIETGSFRFTFYEIPMVFIGALFGPVMGGILGFVVDFFHVLISPWAFSFNVFTLSNMLWGIIPGFLLFGKFNRSRLFVVLVITGILAFGLNTIGIIQYQGTGAMLATLPYRIGVLVVKIPVDLYFIEVIYKRLDMKHYRLLNAKSEG
jgi:ECF transporter S component (folate family)